MLATLATFRVSVAGAAVGVAQAALDEAVAHASGREQFGMPLARLGPVPAMLAQSWVDVESARCTAYPVSYTHLDVYKRQKQRWLTASCRGEQTMAIAISEPDAGSAATDLRTKARRDGDHWVINGAKRWILSLIHI